jgi:hypothetical protein
MGQQADHEALSHRLNELGISHSYSEYEGKFYQCGMQIDPVAEIEMAEWARRDPDPEAAEFAPVRVPQDWWDDLPPHIYGWPPGFGRGPVNHDFDGMVR